MPDDPRPPAPADERTGSRRLRDALLKPGRGQVVVAVLLAVLTYAAVTQVRSNTQNDRYAGLRQSDLIQALNGLSAAQRRSEAEIASLERTRGSLLDSSRRRATALEQARTELATLGILAGTSAATGPGVTITVTPRSRPIRVNHLLDGIEELRDAGAEAMQINGQVRVVAQTSFDDAGNGIEVDGRVLQAPYVIEVIGDSSDLATAMDFPGGFRDDIALDDGTVKVKKSEHVTVDVTRKATTPEFAEPQ